MKKTSHRYVPDVAAQIRAELVARSKGGIYTYLVAWLLISIYFDVHLHAPLFFCINTLLFIASAAVRQLVFNRLSTNEHRNSEPLFQRLIALILFNAFNWGVVASYFIFIYEYGPTKPAACVITAVFAIGGSFLLGVIDRYSITYSAALLLPAVCTGIFYQSENVALFLALIATMFIYTAYTNKEAKKAYLNNLYKQLTVGRHAEEIENSVLTNKQGKESDDIQFALHLQNLWEDNIQLQLPITILKLGINNDTVFQDQYGKIAWQACIEKIKETLHETLSKDPVIISKPHNESFMILLHNDGLPAAENIAKALNLAISEMQFEWFNQTIPITCSIGVASITPNQNISQDTLIRMADKALYNARSSGNNNYATWAALEAKAS